MTDHDTTNLPGKRVTVEYLRGVYMALSRFQISEDHPDIRTGLVQLREDVAALGTIVTAVRPKGGG